MSRVRILGAGRTRVPKPAGLYFSPGSIGSPSYLEQVWKWDGVADPTLVWTAPQYIGIAGMCWTDLTGRLYVFCTNSDYDTGSYGYGETVIYEVDPATDTFAEVFRGRLQSLAWADEQGATGFVELGSAIYCSCQSGFVENYYVAVFDPVSHSFVVEYSETEDYQDFAYGGIGEIGGVLYWVSGDWLHSKSGGTWHRLALLNPTGIVGPWRSGNGSLVTNPDSTAILFGSSLLRYPGGGYPFADYQGSILRVPGDSWAEVASYPVGSYFAGGFTPFWQVRLLRDAGGSAAAREFIALWDLWGGDKRVYSGTLDGLSWTDRGAIPGAEDLGVTPGPAMASAFGKMVLVARGGTGTEMWQMDASYNWSLVKEWPGYTGGVAGDYYIFSMALSRVPYKCQHV